MKLGIPNKTIKRNLTETLGLRKIRQPATPFASAILKTHLIHIFKMQNVEFLILFIYWREGDKSAQNYSLVCIALTYSPYSPDSTTCHTNQLSAFKKPIWCISWKCKMLNVSFRLFVEQKVVSLCRICNYTVIIITT